MLKSEQIKSVQISENLRLKSSTENVVNAGMIIQLEIFGNNNETVYHIVP
jgi:hypothetical protein